VPDHRTALTSSFSRTSFIILEIVLRSTLNNGNLGLTFRTQADHLDRFGLLGRGKLVATAANSTVGASTGETEFGSLVVLRAGKLRPAIFFKGIGLPGRICGSDLGPHSGRNALLFFSDGVCINRRSGKL
jgi:hypothetical protein